MNREKGLSAQGSKMALAGSPAHAQRPVSVYKDTFNGGAATGDVVAVHVAGRRAAVLAPAAAAAVR